MAVVPLTRRVGEANEDVRAQAGEETNWAQMAAAGSLLAGGVLLLAGHKRAGLLSAAAGAALAVLDQQETVKEWWNRLPGYFDSVQGVLTRVENSVAELSEQRDRLHKILSK